MKHRVGNFWYYTGAVHIHTTESDGTRPLKQVVAIGRKVGLDFMMFSDHMGLSNRSAGLEGLYGGTLALIGYEHNDADDNNHYLIFGSPGIYPEHLSAREYVQAARSDGALGIVAHPIEHRPRDSRYPPYPWMDWSADQFDGLEIWNQMSEWMEKLTPFNKLAMLFSPRKSMVGPIEEMLHLWDSLNRTRRCVGVAGVDAHEFPVSIGPFTVRIFPYKVHFRCLRTQIILDEPLASDFATAASQLYNALRRCRVYVSNVRWGDSHGFEFLAQAGDAVYTCGDGVPSHEGARLLVRSPALALIRIVCDSRVIAEARSRTLTCAAKRPGLYRAEVWKGRRGWIFSNHIRVGV